MIRGERRDLSPAAVTSSGCDRPRCSLSLSRVPLEVRFHVSNRIASTKQISHDKRDYFLANKTAWQHEQIETVAVALCGSPSLIRQVLEEIY